MVRGACIVIALLLTACSPSQTPEIVFAVATAPGVLDPLRGGITRQPRVNALLYDRLVELDEQGRPKPSMARWQVLAPRHYRVTLLPRRAAFWDGRKPDAADVVATYSSLLHSSLGSPHAGALSHIIRVSAHSDTEVDFFLARPDPEFPARLTIGIAPAKRLNDSGLARSPMGSGPFSFAGFRTMICPPRSRHFLS